jgi:hypothetical protein
MLLQATVCHANAFMNVCLPSSATWKSIFDLPEDLMQFIHYGVSCVSSMLLQSAELQLSGSKKLRYNPLCDADEESRSDILSEELITDSDDDVIIWKLKDKLRV